jgi:hypothetical protein
MKPPRATPATTEDLVQIAAVLREHQQKLDAILLRATPAPVLTVAEAAAYTKHDSDTAFYRWCSRWRVLSCAQGRYARGQLDRGLQREAAHRRPSRAAA